VDYNLKEAKDSIVEGILAYDKHRCVISSSAVHDGIKVIPCQLNKWPMPLRLRFCSYLHQI